MALPYTKAYPSTDWRDAADGAPNTAIDKVALKHMESGLLDLSTHALSHGSQHDPDGSDPLAYAGKIHMSGTESARPAAASGNAGALYYATDTFTLWRSDGSAWALRSWDWHRLLNGGTAWEGPSPGARIAATADVATLTSGRVTVVALPLPKGTIISKLMFHSGATPSATLTHSWGVLFDAAGNILAKSPDVTSAITADTDITCTLTSPQTIPSTGVCYAGLMVAAGTPPTLRGPVGLVVGLSDGLDAAQKILYGKDSQTGLTTPASFTGTLNISTISGNGPLVVAS